jgi:DNA segregation ATPase FtsK/SpoIIIE-like protein
LGRNEEKKTDLKNIRPSKGRSRNGMNLSGTVNIEELLNEAPEKEEKEGMSLQCLINSKNSIKQKNQEYVDFIKEIEEFSPENEKEVEIKSKKKKKRNFKKKIPQQEEIKKQEKIKSNFETRKNTISLTGKAKRDWTKEELVNFDTEKIGGSDIFSSYEFEYNSILMDGASDVREKIIFRMKIQERNLKTTSERFGNEKQKRKFLIGYWKFT